MGEIGLDECVKRGEEVRRGRVALVPEDKRRLLTGGQTLSVVRLGDSQAIAAVLWEFARSMGLLTVICSQQASSCSCCVRMGKVMGVRVDDVKRLRAV